MALYDTYWKGILQTINAEQDFTKAFEETFSDTGIETVGNRKSSGWSGYLEFFAFNTRRKTNSQVFRDLEEVLKKYTGLRNKLGGQLDVRVNKSNEVTFKYEPFSWELMMNRYRDSQDQTQMEKELYKWELVKQFQSFWKQYEDGQLSFVDLMGQANWENLVYHMFTPNFDYLITQKPQEVEQAFVKLYDEQAPLQGRIDEFRDTLEALHNEVRRKPKDVLFLNERETATILAFRYPDKYALFMPTFYASLAKALGRKSTSKWNQLVDYYEIVNDFRENELPKYEDIIAVKNRLTSDSKFYPDNKHLLLIQDIFYITLMKGFEEEESTDEEEEDVDIVKQLQQFELQEVEAFFYAFDKIQNKQSLESGDERFVFSLAEKRLTFTIGQRFILNLFPIKQRNGGATFGVIGEEAFGVVSKPYDGSPTAFFNRVKSLNLSNGEWQSLDKAVTTELNRSKKSGYYKYNHGDFEKMAFDHAYRHEILQLAFPEKQEKIMSTSSPKNMILFGPPGTGKTYNSIDKAVAIIDGTSNDHEANKKRYDELVDAGQVQFVTFHQSMSYEDFVEGIKPETIDDDVVYNVKPGIFKQICNQARAAGKTGNNFENAYQSLLKEIKENEGKLVLETLVHSKEFTIYENSKGNLKFHSNTEKAYEGVIKQNVILHYLKTAECLDWPSYVKSVAKHMREHHGYTDKAAKSSKNFVLVIDEINRGNVSQIFGELITLIEEDKREGEPNAISVTLPYSKNDEGRFSVPSNLYIVGTMNTADKSVEALDSALRRRFSFIEMPAKPELLSSNTELGGVKLNELLNVINSRIEKLLDKDHQIGHSYFMNIHSEEDLKAVFRDKIIPLLQEYFFGDFGKIGLVLGKSFIEMDSGSFAGFADFDYEGGALSDLQERIVYSISPEKAWDISAILHKNA